MIANWSTGIARGADSTPFFPITALVAASSMSTAKNNPRKVPPMSYDLSPDHTPEHEPYQPNRQNDVFDPAELRPKDVGEPAPAAAPDGPPRAHPPTGVTYPPVGPTHAYDPHSGLPLYTHEGDKAVPDDVSDETVATEWQLVTNASGLYGEELYTFSGDTPGLPPTGTVKDEWEPYLGSVTDVTVLPKPEDEPEIKPEATQE